MDKFFGLPIAPSPDADVVRGYPGSPGRVRGPARVIRTLDEVNKLRAGDVLVAESTLPAWTPVFATAVAVVTDVGGMTSHCAVVAREYQIPAVIDTGIATSVIRDGQVPDVDGSAGIVRNVSRALNAEDCYGALLQAAQKYFAELRKDPALQAALLRRLALRR